MSGLPVLEDRFEGKTPARSIEGWSRALEDAQDEASRQAIRANIDRIRSFAASFYRKYYVSCWHLKDVENATMWQAYTSSANWVAIRTTIEDLRGTLPLCIEIGEVRYIDYQSEGFSGTNMFEWVMHKRRQYADECEVRAVGSTTGLSGSTLR
jgi:hypothetical protein